MIFEAYERSAKQLAIEFEKAGDVTHPIREVLMNIEESDPLESFVPSSAALQDTEL